MSDHRGWLEAGRGRTRYLLRGRCRCGWLGSWQVEDDARRQLREHQAGQG